MTQLSKALVAGSLVLAAGAVTVQGAAASPAAGGVRWGPCTQASLGSLSIDPRQQCATVAVPLDYRDPGGRQVKVAISRIRSTLPGLRRGVLLMNPGGPGMSGLGFPSVYSLLLPPQVLARYDLIGFDPRGVGRSSPVGCGLKPGEIDPTKLLPYPAPNGDITENIAVAKKMAADCDRASGPTLRYVTTANTARDMDRIRAALGESTISYFGLSYGTYLGAVYATLFPQRTDRVVLDSAVDPTQVWRAAWKGWGPSIGLRVADYFGWLADRDLVYHLGRTPQQVRRQFFELVGRLDRKPAKLPDGTVITGNRFRDITRIVLYTDFAFPIGGALWQVLKAGGGGPAIPGLAQLLPGSDDNTVAASTGIVCNDARWPLNAEQHAREVAVDRRRWPVTGGMPANIWPCAYWPYKLAEPPVTVTDHGPANILIAQNRRDPATPYRNAVSLRHAFGDRARLVAADAGGHGSYRLVLNSCTDNAVSQFLVTGRLPRTDVSCPAAGDPAQLLARLSPRQRQALDALRTILVAGQRPGSAISRG